MNQSKYVADLLEEKGCAQMKSADTPLEVPTKLDPQVGKRLRDQGKYRRIVGKLIYLTVTGPHIPFAMSVVNQFMQY